MPLSRPMTFPDRERRGGARYEVPNAWEWEEVNSVRNILVLITALVAVGAFLIGIPVASADVPGGCPPGFTEIAADGSPVDRNGNGKICLLEPVAPVRLPAVVIDDNIP